MVQTHLCDLLDIEYPILQGGLGPVGTIDLAVAVSEAGGLGTISQSGTNASPSQARSFMKDQLRKVVERTDENIAINVPVGNLSDPIKHVKTREGYLTAALDMKLNDDRVREQLKLVITSYGSPERRIEDIAAVKEKTDLRHFHKVANVHHAKKVEEMGVDGVIAAGAEMGGHTHPPDNAVHTFVLVPQVASAVDVPVVAAGGMKDGRSLLAALALGARGISMGTRFITSAESDFDPGFKEAIVDSSELSDEVIEELPLRTINTPGLEEYKERIQELDHGEIAELEIERSTLAQSSGNVQKGIVVSGQIGTYIDSIESVEAIIDGIIKEAQNTYQQLAPCVSS